MVQFTLDAAVVVQLLLTVVAPIAVGLVTTKTTSSAVKSWLLAGITLAVSLLTGLGEAIATNTAFDVGMALLAAIPAFAISVSTYYGLWKPTGVGAAVQKIKVTTLVK